MTLRNSSSILATISQGHYNVVSLVKELTDSLRKNNKINLQIETNNPNSVLKIINSKPDIFTVSLSHSSAGLMGISIGLGELTYVKKLNSPSTYFIHCDLIDPTKNFLNGKRSDV